MNLALFDLDNTLLSGDSDYEWGRFLISKNAVDKTEQEAKNLYFYEQYQAGTLDIDAFLDFQLTPLAAHPRQQLDAWVQEFLATTIRPLIGEAARQLVKHHLNEGDIVAVVTATNSFVTGPIVREFGISNLIATIPAHLNGEFTGKARDVPSFREGKVARVESWLESIGLYMGSFAQSWFYSDSLNDLPLLQHVTLPVAVDPDDTLREHAQRHGWPILSLRSR